MSKCPCCQQALPQKVYRPESVTLTTWFRTWSMNCGHCGKDFVRFSFLGRPRCPHCGTKNNPCYSPFYI